MSERDPRIAPRTGDELRRKHERRRVLELDHDSLGLLRGVHNLVFDDRRERQKGTSRRRLNLMAWRQWARNAEVLKRGDEKGEAKS